MLQVTVAYIHHYHVRTYNNSAKLNLADLSSLGIVSDTGYAAKKQTKGNKTQRQQSQTSLTVGPTLAQRWPNHQRRLGYH